MKTYFEVHFIDEDNPYKDVEFVGEYRGKAMRSYSTALKCQEMLKKKYPHAHSWDIAEYDEDGRID